MATMHCHAVLSGPCNYILFPQKMDTGLFMLHVCNLLAECLSKVLLFVYYINYLLFFRAI
jgi:hypothetical protein